MAYSIKVKKILLQNSVLSVGTPHIHTASDHVKGFCGRSVFALNS
jgi:hypothetical protein